MNVNGAYDYVKGLLTADWIKNVNEKNAMVMGKVPRTPEDLVRLDLAIEKQKRIIMKSVRHQITWDVLNADTLQKAVDANALAKKLKQPGIIIERIKFRMLMGEELL